MKKIALILVAVFEIICGLAGIVMLFGWLLGTAPYDAVPILWYGIFPLLSIIAGVLVLLRTYYAADLTIFVLAVQIPYVYVSGVSVFRLGIAFNMYLTAVWNSRAGVNATVLGFNVLAIAVLIVFLWCRAALKDDTADRSRTDLPTETNSPNTLG